MRFIGVDLHKTYAYVFELGQDGAKKHYRVTLGTDELSAFLGSLDQDAQVVVEASTNSFRSVSSLRRIMSPSRGPAKSTRKRASWAGSASARSSVTPAVFTHSFNGACLWRAGARPHDNDSC